MFSRFSSLVMPSAVFTWKSWVFPTMHTAGVPASSTAARTSSFSADRPARLVMPNAVSVARAIAGAASKNPLSVGLAPGQPPSTWSIPSASRAAAMRILSSVEKSTPWVCCPSRRVVS